MRTQLFAFRSFSSTDNSSGKRYLEIHLFYTDDCPQEYEPRGFTPASHNHVVYPSNEHWAKETQSCGTMGGGFHRYSLCNEPYADTVTNGNKSVGLKVTSLKWTGDDQGDSTSRPEIPETVDYSEPVPRGEDIGIGDSSNVFDVVPPSQSTSLFLISHN